MEWRKSLACALALAGMMAFGPGVRQAALAADTHNLTILGGGSGGLWAIISEGVGETLRRSMPNVRVTTEPGKDGPNQVMTSRGEVQFALATDVLTLKAIKGEAPFKGRKLDNLRLVAVMNPINALQFFVDAKTGAKSIQDIKDKKIPLRITVNRQGTLIDVATEELLKTYGITYSDIAKWGGKVHKIPGPEATDLWDAGQMDAIVEVSQFPTSRFYELGQKHDLIVLPIDPANQEKLNKELGTSSLTIPAARTRPGAGKTADALRCGALYGGGIPSGIPGCGDGACGGSGAHRPRGGAFARPDGRSRVRTRSRCRFRTRVRCGGGTRRAVFRTRYDGRGRFCRGVCRGESRYGDARNGGACGVGFRAGT